VVEAVRILDEIKAGNVQPVYFLCGEEAYYIDLISNYLEEHLLDESEKAFNQTIVYGKEADVSHIIEAARRFPMMAERQLVMIKEAQSMRGIEKLESYIEQPTSSTVLVICYKYKKPDRRKSFGKKVSSKSVYLETKKLYENQLPDWIQSYARSHKLKISQKAVTLLSEYIGNDLARMAGELEKLVINLKEGEEIQDKHVEQYIGISKDYNVFELINKLSERKVEQVLKIVKYFRSNPKEHPLVVILGVLYNHFSKILAIHYMQDQHPKHIETALGVRPFVARELVKASHAFNARQSAQAISLLREYDLKTKGLGNVSVSDGELLEELMVRILK